MFKPTTAKTPEEYLDLVAEPRKTQMKELDAFIRKTTPKLKSFIISGMIGYGSFHYKSKSGREGDWALIGLASQKNYISLYICASDGRQYVPEKYKKDLPKTKIGRSCINIKKIEDVNFDVLKKILLEAERLGGSFAQ